MGLVRGWVSYIVVFWYGSVCLFVFKVVSRYIYGFCLEGGNDGRVVGRRVRGVVRVVGFSFEIFFRIGGGLGFF